MITKTINVYSYDELSDSAKDKIRERWRNCPYGLMEPFNGEYESTLEKFCEICDIKMKYWEVDTYMHNFSINFCERYPYERCDKDGYVDEYIALESLSGKLLFRYVLNNIIPYLIRGKYHSKYYYDHNGKWHCKSRRSRVVMEDEPEKGYCPITGVCMDCDIIEPLMKYYRNWAKYPADYTFEDLMNECMESFFTAWQNEYEYRYSDEGIDEVIEANFDDKLFFSDGTECRGEADEIAA